MNITWLLLLCCLLLSFARNPVYEAGSFGDLWQKLLRTFSSRSQSSNSHNTGNVDHQKTTAVDVGGLSAGATATTKATTSKQKPDKVSRSTRGGISERTHKCLLPNCLYDYCKTEVDDEPSLYPVDNKSLERYYQKLTTKPFHKFHRSHGIGLVPESFTKFKETSRRFQKGVLDLHWWNIGRAVFVPLLYHCKVMRDDVMIKCVGHVDDDIRDAIAKAFLFDCVGLFVFMNQKLKGNDEDVANIRNQYSDPDDYHRAAALNRHIITEFVKSIPENSITQEKKDTSSTP